MQQKVSLKLTGLKMIILPFDHNFFFFYFYIYPLDLQKSMGGVILGQLSSSYANLLPKMPRYCYLVDVFLVFINDMTEV